MLGRENFHVGLVVTRKKNHAKASCDFMGIVTIEEKNCLQACRVRLDLYSELTSKRELSLSFSLIFTVVHL